MQIQDKVIVITGASEGIGAAAARHLASLGAKVVLAARSEAKLQAVQAEIPGSLAVVTDMTVAKDVENLLNQTVEHFGRIDVLINNAGQAIYGPVATLDIEQYKGILELNVVGPLRAMELVIPIMREQGAGMILNISSGVSKNYYPNLGGYASTKYALNALSLTARTELAPEHIVVSVMHPGMTATDFGKNSIGMRAEHITGTTRPKGHSAERVAEAIAEQIVSEQDEYHLYQEPYPESETV